MTVTGSVQPALGAPRGPGGLFRHRDFRLLWIGETTSKLGSSVASVALPLVAVAVLDARTFQVAMLSAAAWLPWLLIGLPGWRLGGPPAASAGDACLLLSASVPVAAWMHRLTIGQVLVVALGAGTASVFFRRPTRCICRPYWTARTWPRATPSCKRARPPRKRAVQVRSA
ncbi:MAG: hypothetical protein ACRDRJ_14960 [Streptosporangiaceae bacterium]